MKPVPKGNKGLAKLPTDVRNKMGFMSKGGSLKIKSGDTLSQIAKKQGTTVKAIVAANPSITNANMIKVGQTIKIPSNTRTTNPYKGMTSKEITSGKMATRKRKPAPKRAAKKANPKQPIKKSVFGNIKKMLGMKKAGGTVRK